jgi:hypothetical protein
MTLEYRRHAACLTRRDLADRTSLPIATIIRAERHPDRVSDPVRLKIEQAIEQRERALATGAGQDVQS